MPADVRATVQKSLTEALAYGNAIAKQKASGDRKLITDSGRSKILDLTDAERQQWVKAMKPVWKKFERQLGKDMINAALAANK